MIKYILTPVAVFAALTLNAHEDHDHNQEHDHEHEIYYFDEGHLDIIAAYHEVDNALEFSIIGDEHGHAHDDHAHDDDAHDDHAHDDHAHDDHGEGEYPENVRILANNETVVEITEALSFLGEVGTNVYILPQNPAVGPVAPGLVFQADAGVFVDDSVTFTLGPLDGPGSLVVYTIDGFGAVDIMYDSRDGSEAPNSATLVAGSHQHFAWAFSEEGVYTLDIAAMGTLSAGGEVGSAPTEIIFQVGEDLSYLEEVDAYEDGWANSGNLGNFYTGEFPWMYSTLFGGWTYADGEGGETMLLFSDAASDWLFTGREIAPWAYRYNADDWSYFYELPDGTVIYWSESTGSWVLE